VSSQRLNRLSRRTSSRNYVFNHECAFTGRSRKSPSQRHFSILSLGPNKPRSQSTRDFVANYNSANGRRCDQLDILIPKMVSQTRSERLRIPGLLQDQRTLKVNAAM
jgi:hypothetical protein